MDLSLMQDKNWEKASNLLVNCWTYFTDSGYNNRNRQMQPTLQTFNCIRNRKEKIDNGSHTYVYQHNPFDIIATYSTQ